MGILIFINKPEYVKRYLKLQEINDKIRLWVISILAVLLILLAIILTLNAILINPSPSSQPPTIPLNTLSYA